MALLEKELAKIDLYNPSHLRIVADRCAVSDPTLTIRIRSKFSEGAVLCCDKREDGWFIEHVQGGRWERH